RATQRRHGAELDDPGDPKPLHGPLSLDADHVAESEALLRGGRPVDHHLVAVRPAAADERERIEARVAARNAETEVGRAAEDDRLAVLADQLGDAVHLRLGL